MDDHHGEGRLALWCNAPFGLQESLLDEDAVRSLRPPYVGVCGWIGVRFDRGEHWERVAGLIELAYRQTAPRKLVALIG